MIVVVGSRHDPVATDLVARWPRAALCAAEDLVRPGWVWPHAKPHARTWIIAGKTVADEQVSGVFLRRSTVHAEELTPIDPADRAFVAAESHAFLTFVLATTAARVVNPVIDGAFGEEAMRPERWAAAATEVGLSVRPLRVASEPRREPRARTYEVEVAGAEVLGKAPRGVLENVRRFAQALGIAWAVLLFDERHRLVAVTGANPPSDAAIAALGRLLGATRR